MAFSLISASYGPKDNHPQGETPSTSGEGGTEFLLRQRPANLGLRKDRCLHAPPYETVDPTRCLSALGGRVARRRGERLTPERKFVCEIMPHKRGANDRE